MRLIVLIVLFFSFNTFACGEKSTALFSPFAVLVENGPDDEMQIFELNFPVKDVKEKDFFLNSIRVTVGDLFDLDVDYFERKKYVGDFYTAYLKLGKSLKEKVHIEASYNGGNKDGTSIYLCGNFKEYELVNLLEVKAPSKRKNQ